MDRITNNVLSISYLSLSRLFLIMSESCCYKKAWQIPGVQADATCLLTDVQHEILRHPPGPCWYYGTGKSGAQYAYMSIFSTYLYVQVIWHGLFYSYIELSRPG